MLADLNRLGSSFGLALATHGADHAGWRVYRATDALSRSRIDLLLCEHLDDHVGSDDIIDELGYDTSYLSAYIKRETARTFKQLVNEERMRHAIRMLRNSQEPIYKIAQNVGISNLTQFYRRFHEYAGMTPQEYRTSPLR